MKIPLTVCISLVACIFILACTSKPPLNSVPTSANKPRTVSLSSLESGILNEVNKYRRSRGLPGLQSNSVIETEAAAHSQRMASKRVPFSHQGFSGRMARIESRLGKMAISGENVAYGKLTAAEVVKVWISSTAHRKNLEENFLLTGIGVSRDEQGNIFFTQIFARKS